MLKLTLVLRTCIYLTYDHTPVIYQELVETDNPLAMNCSSSEGTGLKECHISIERSTDLVNWSPFVDADISEYATMSLIEQVSAKGGVQSFYKITVN